MKDIMYGDKPSNSVVFAACDSKYFMDHSVPFIMSSCEAGFKTHIHVVNPTEEVHSLSSLINKLVDGDITYSFEDRDVTPLDSESERAYYACLRFIALPEILSSAKEVLVLDIDCLIMKEFDFPETPCAYFPRPNEQSEEMKVAAGAVYLTSDALNVAQAIQQTIGGMQLRWFVDQIALSHIFNQVPENFITKFDNQFMDWEFEEGTCIWTGKGPRKYDNPKYVSRKNYYVNRFNDMRSRC